MIQFIEVVRAIATMLIANSHFNGVYPTDLLSFGGGFGLALFYMISGFLLANIKPNAKLTSWYTKKVVRLYIPLVILKLIEMLIGYLKIETVGQFFREFSSILVWCIDDYSLFGILLDCQIFICKKGHVINLDCRYIRCNIFFSNVCHEE